jgi:hypothetical protein
MPSILRAIGPAGRFLLALAISIMLAAAIVGAVTALVLHAPWTLGYVGVLAFLLFCRILAS